MSSMAKVAGLVVAPVVGFIATRVLEKTTRPQTAQAQYLHASAIQAAVAAGAWGLSTVLHGESESFAEGAVWGGILAAVAFGARPLVQPSKFRDENNKLLPANLEKGSIFVGSELSPHHLRALAAEVR